MFELSTQVLAEEAKQRFIAAQLQGNPKRASQMLDGLGALKENSSSSDFDYWANVYFGGC